MDAFCEAKTRQVAARGGPDTFIREGDAQNVVLRSLFMDSRPLACVLDLAGEGLEVWDIRALSSVWPAECRVCAYWEPGLPIDAIRRVRMLRLCMRCR